MGTPWSGQYFGFLGTLLAHFGTKMKAQNQTLERSKRRSGRKFASCSTRGFLRSM
jgi:hypothetical protein